MDRNITLNERLFSGKNRGGIVAKKKNRTATRAVWTAEISTWRWVGGEEAGGEMAVWPPVPGSASWLFCRLEHLDLNQSPKTSHVPLGIFNSFFSHAGRHQHGGVLGIWLFCWAHWFRDLQNSPRSWPCAKSMCFQRQSPCRWRMCTMVFVSIVSTGFITHPTSHNNDITLLRAFLT